MRLRIRFVLICFALAIFAQSASATTVSLISTIRTIDAQADGRIVLTFHDESPNCINTSSPKFHYLTVGQNGMTAEGFKNAHATAMLAVALGKSVHIYFNSQSSACYISRIILRNLTPP